MRMMVLHFAHRHAVAMSDLPADAAAVHVRMRVHGHEFRHAAHETRQRLRHLPQAVHGFGRFQVADMRRGDHAVLEPDGDRVFQLRAHGENRALQAMRQPDRIRRKAARAPPDLGRFLVSKVARALRARALHKACARLARARARSARATTDAYPRDYNRIVAAQVDLAVVQQEEIGDAAQTRAGFVIGDAGRRPSPVAAGHDQPIERRRRIACKRRGQQDLQRRGGEHDAQRVRVGSK